MPAKNRVWRHNRGQLSQGLAAKDFPFGSEPASLIVVQKESLFAQLFQKHLDLDTLKFIDLLLVTIDPAGENQKEELPRSENETHVGPQW